MNAASGWLGSTPGADRLTAAATGDLHAAVQDVARSIHREAKGDHYKAVQLGFTLMKERGVITSSEVEQLLVLLKAVRECQSTQSVPHAVAQNVRNTYHTLLADSKSSPAAVAIASAVNNLMVPINTVDAEGTEKVVYLATRDGVALGAFIGGVVGALIGAAGGAGGILAGVGVGVAVGGTVGASFSSDND